MHAIVVLVFLKWLKMPCRIVFDCCVVVD